MGGGGSASPSPEKGDISGPPAPQGLVFSTLLSPGLLRPPPSPVWVDTGRPRGIGRSLGPQPEAGDLWEAVTVPLVSEGPGVGAWVGQEAGPQGRGGWEEAAGCSSGDGMSQGAGAWLLGEGGGRFHVLTGFIPMGPVRLSLSVAISILQMGKQGPREVKTQPRPHSRQVLP